MGIDTSQSIFNSEAEKLKREFIDTEKAVVVMKSIKLKEAKEMQEE
jgi:hypothetical protein